MYIFITVYYSVGSDRGNNPWHGKGISKHITDDEISHELLLYYQQAKASRLVIKQCPTNLVGVIFSSREELEHAIIESLWLDNGLEIWSLQ